MEKRLIIAIVLSVLIVFLFQNFIVKPNQPATAPAIDKESVVTQPLEPASIASQEIPAITEKDVVMNSDKFNIVLSNIGGAIKEVSLKDFIDPGSGKPLELIKLTNPLEYIFSLQNSTDSNNQFAICDYSMRQEDGSIICTGSTKDFQIIKKYTLHKSSNIIELQLSITNIAKEPKTLSYNIITGGGIDEIRNEDKRFVEVMSKVNEKRIKYKHPKTGKITNIGNVSWTALKNRYFSLIAKPFMLTKGEFYYINKKGTLVNGIESRDILLQPTHEINDKFILYAGPGSISSLSAAGNGFIETIDYGFFGSISKLLIYTLRFFYRISHSWGIAIVLLAIFLNAILFPMTAKSFKSMQKMQELHPQMEKLKAQYKDNSQKLNQEIVELYKKYNINPLSGCLPMLLQMPVFIALYQALMKAIELRGSKFLWINDLSSTESLPLPISFPIIGNTINILPLVMIGAMVLQQKISSKYMGSAVTSEQQQQQKMMLVLMPVIFGFIFYNMPSGLVLYWVINTILTTMEQIAILRNA